MQSVLVVSKDKDKRKDFVLSLCEENEIDRIDMDCYSFDKAIGIDDIRSLQKKIVLKPIKSQTKAVVVDSERGFTIEAQNAFLKILEEPPPNTVIYITVSNKNLIVPTILSRCKVVELKDNGLELSKEEVFQYLNILISLPKKTTGERLKLAQDIAKNKDEVIVWLEKMTFTARELLLLDYNLSLSNTSRSAFVEFRRTWADRHSSITQLVNTLTSLQKAYTVMKTTNANQRLVLENLLLAL